MLHQMNLNYVKRIRRYLGSQKIILNCAGGIVEKDGKILFQHRTDNDKWGLVGGLLELNETYLEAAIREIKEETGLDVKPKYFLGIFHFAVINVAMCVYYHHNPLSKRFLH